MPMRDRTHLRWARALVALLACAGCLLPAVPSSLAGDGHGTESVAAGLAPSEAAHDRCWTAEVDDHLRHDDRRFETQRGLHHHRHAGVAWSSAAPVGRPVQAAHAALPALERARLPEALGRLSDSGSSPRQTRAPPRG